MQENTVKHYQAIVRQNPEDPAGYFNLAGAFKNDGNLESALKCYRKAIELDPLNAEFHNSLGITFVSMGDIGNAMECFKKALALNSDHWDARYNLGNALKELGNLDEAIEQYGLVTGSVPEFVDALYNLGNALKEKGMYEDAIYSYQKALAINPSHVEALNNIGVTLHDRMLFQEALKYFHNALSVSPGYPEAHFNRALTLLLMGDFKEGWKEHEWRWKKKDYLMHQRNFIQPQWDGSDIQGKTVLLHAEQGYGDTIQFIRYAPLVARMGAKVIVECQPALARLLKNIEGVSSVLQRGENTPDFDMHCPILSLPFMFRTDLSTIPVNIPYVKAPEEAISKWGEIIGDNKNRLKVGISWAGNPDHRNDRNRSCGFGAISRLMEMQGVDFYSLQVLNKGGGVHPRLIDRTEEINNFEDTAGLINNLDLVVTVDTAVAHLAGAMDKEVWLMLPYVPDWRWLLERKDSPWYPCMRIFRQDKPKDWGPVVDRTMEALNVKTTRFFWPQ